jgi:hypothetical protein
MIYTLAVIIHVCVCCDVLWEHSTELLNGQSMHIVYKIFIKSVMH